MQSWTIGIVSGVIVTGFLPVLPPGYIAAGLAVITATLCICPSTLARFGSGIACGSLLGVLHGYALLQHRIADDCVAQPLLVTGRIDSLPRRSPTRDGGIRQQFEFVVTDLSPARCAGPRRLMLSHYGEERVTPGEEWQFEASLRKPWGTVNPGSFNLQAWFAQRGVDAVGSVRASGIVQQRQAAYGLPGLHHRYRERIVDRIRALELDGPSAAILRAVTVADKSGIDPRLWDLFQQFGLNHLLVISGLHVGMVAAVGYLLGGVCTRLFGMGGLGGTRIPGVCALLSAGGFAALAGFSLPTQRALCMLACFVLAGWFSRRSSAHRSLLLSAVLVLLLNPLAAVGSGFWLSFGSVAALCWLARWQRGRGVPWRLLGANVFMALFMLPMGALFFAGGSLVAAPANLLMIPLVGWFVVPLGLLGSVSLLWGSSLADSLWRLAAWPLSQSLSIAESLSGQAGTGLYLSLSASPLEAACGVLAVLLLVLPGVGKLRYFALVLALPVFLPARVPPAGQTAITVLDVGQGTAVVIRAGDRALLYDTGGGDPQGANLGRRVVLPYLGTLGITTLDTLVISHPDLDHSAGTGAVLDALEVDRYRYGGEPAAHGGRPCVAGEAWRWPGGQAFQFLSPAVSNPAGRNDGSCVLQVELGDFSLLLPGDIEAPQERALVQYWGDRLDSDWLLAAHHGSVTSTGATFLKHVSPGTAVISRGYANRFGHPHPAVTGRLARRGVVLWDTATDGALEFRFVPGGPVEVVPHRRLSRFYWM
jgi:competence protein ComEC